MTCASKREGGSPPRRLATNRLATVSIKLGNRTYRFSCGENEVERLQDVAKYLKAKLEALVTEHGTIGDERLIVMAALTLADELFDARADIDDLLRAGPGERTSLQSRLESVEASLEDETPELLAKRG